MSTNPTPKKETNTIKIEITLPNGEASRIEMPPWTWGLFDKRVEYHVCYGGRSAGRSWNIGLALLIQGMEQPRKVLCVREHVANIQESVHSQLQMLIEHYKLDHFYRVAKKEIIGSNGTQFIFRGLIVNPEGLKSIPGITDCWVEEAQTMTERSWKVLEPTIRTPGRRFFLSFNPTIETGFVWRHFVKGTLPRMRRYYAIYLNNPFISPEIEESAEHARLNDYPDYQHRWLGVPLPALEGAVYEREISDILGNDKSTRRILRFLPDYTKPTYVACDLGRTDLTSLWFFQQEEDGFYTFVDYYENSGLEWSHYIAAIQGSPYNVVCVILPHDANHKSIQGTGASVFEQTVNADLHAEVLDKIAINDGIGFVRTMLKRSIFLESQNVLQGVERLRQYTWATNSHGAQMRPVHSPASHAADALRYAATYCMVHGGAGRSKARRVIDGEYRIVSGLLPA